MRRIARLVVSLVVGSSTVSCGIFGGEDPRFTLTATTPSAVVQQGGAAIVVIDVGRTAFDKPVTLAVEGALSEGLTTSFTQNPVPNGSATTTLNILATGAATPGTVNLVLKGTGEGVPEQSLAVTITINVRGSHTVSLVSSSLTVAQGGGGVATVLLARQNSNAGNVTLSVNAPAGFTATFGQSPTTASATSLTLSTNASVAAGSYDLTVTGSQPGVTPNPTATLTVTVIAAPATTNVSIPFCSTGLPVWFAFQNEGFLWQRVTAVGNTFSFAATDKLAIAFTFQAGSESDIRFYQATRAELAGLNDRDCPGPKNHPGTTAGVTAAMTAIVALGASVDEASDNAFQLDGVASRALDLVATRGSASNDLLTPNKMILRRGLNLASGQAIVPTLDFEGSEAFTPASNTLTVAGLDANDFVYVETNFLATTSTFGFLFSNEVSSSTITMHSVPAAQQVSGDLHELFIEAFNSSGTVGHAIATHFGAPGDRTETVGPILTTPTVSVAASAPFVRERGQLSFQSAYPTAVRFVFLQGQSPARKFVVVVTTAGYLGAAPTTWDMTVPDVGSVPGFNAAWMHASSQPTAFSVEGFSSRGDLLFGALPVSGESLKFAYRVSSFTTPSALRAANTRARVGPRRALLNPPPQYLRR